jgi:hypothetical protein
MMIKHRLEACSLSRIIIPWTSQVDGIVLDLTGLASRISNNTGSVPAVQALLWFQVVVEDVVEVETWARNRVTDFSGTCWDGDATHGQINEALECKNDVDPVGQQCV